MPNPEYKENVCYEPTQCDATTRLMEEVCLVRDSRRPEIVLPTKAKSNIADIPLMGNILDKVTETFTDIERKITTIKDLSESKTTKDLLRNGMKAFALLDHDMIVSTNILRPLLKGLTGNPSAEILLEGVTNIEKHGDKVDLKRAGKLTIPVGQELIMGYKVDSIDLGSMGFKVLGDPDNPRLTNISGINIKVSDASGEMQSIPLQEVSLKAVGTDELEINAQVKNPWPMVLREDRPGCLPIKLTLKKNGGITWSGSLVDLL